MASPPIRSGCDGRASTRSASTRCCSSSSATASTPSAPTTDYAGRPLGTSSRSTSVGRVAVPLFLLLAGEHIGPRLLRDRAPGAGMAVRPPAGDARSLRHACSTGSSTSPSWPAAAASAARLARPSLARQLPIRLTCCCHGARPHLWFLVALMVVVVLAAVVLARGARARRSCSARPSLYGIGLAFGPYASGPERPARSAVARIPAAVAAVLRARRRSSASSANTCRAAGSRYTLIATGLAIHALEVLLDLASTYGMSPFRLAMLLGTVPYAAGVGMLALAPERDPLDRWAGALRRCGARSST